jgi:hypothetical protein
LVLVVSNQTGVQRASGEISISLLTELSWRIYYYYYYYYYSKVNLKLHKKRCTPYTMNGTIYGAMFYSAWLLCVSFWNFKLAKFRIHQCVTLVFSVHWNSMKVDTTETFHWWIVVWRQLYLFREQYFKITNILDNWLYNTEKNVINERFSLV